MEFKKRKHVHAWQWSDYFQKHRNQSNLIIHLIAVPTFWLGTINLIRLSLGLGFVLIFVSFVLQGIGHRKEKETPTPFIGPVDFITRFITEQFITFPRFVFSGQWIRSFRDVDK